MTKPVRGQSQVQFTEYWHLIRQNKWWIFFLTIGLTVVSAFIIALLPNRFQASATLLVDPQRVPDDPGSGPGPARPSSLTDRLRTTTQEVLLSAPRLQDIITKYRLDPELRGTASSFRVRWLHMTLSDDEVIEAMRKRIEITVKQSGNNSPVTVILSYEAEDPTGAAQVANELTRQLIEWNVQGRQQQTSSATQFLKDQVEQTKKNIDEQEKVMRDFKMRHSGEMPGDLQNDLQTLTQLREMRQANSDSLNRLSQEYVELTKPTAVVSGGKSNQPLTEREKLKDEKAQLQDKLKDLLKRYTPSFPEAVETQTRLNQVDEQLKNLPAETAESREAASPNASRIEANRRSTERLNAEQKRIDAEVADYEQKVAAIPLREQEFSELTRNYNITKQDYQTLFQKEAQAEMTESLENEQGADRFVVLDAARPPERPYKPNRTLLLGTALVASIMLSGGLVIGKEQLSNTIRSEENLSACLPESVAVLALIPTIRTARDTSRRRIFAGFAFCVLLAACFLVVVLFRKTLSL